MRLSLFLLLFFHFSTRETFAQMVSNSSPKPEIGSSIDFAFGSCIRHTADLSIFDTILKCRPDYTLFLGDIGYVDSQNQDTSCHVFDSIYSNPSFKRLRTFSTVYGTWDDHDYGLNDGGKYFQGKVAAKERYLDFYDVPMSSSVRTHEGIYTSYRIQSEGKTVQVILLDLRTFRSNLNVNTNRVLHPDMIQIPEYLPIESPDSTLLGSEQWVWLKKVLEEPADVRLLCSSIQFAHSFNGYESWNNFPHEKQRLIDLIAQTKAEGLLVLSGDVHFAEYSKIYPEKTYPLYDFTSSGLSSKWHSPTINTNRISEPVMENHFGLLDINWKEERITVYVIDRTNTFRISQQVYLSELRFK
jgi:alkaline phosphatase D